MAVNSTGSSTGGIYSSFSKNRIGGLATGLDTDSLVEALTSGTRSKIAKQGQDRQILNWKMTAYRGIATALTALQKKYHSTSSSSTTSISSNAFFNTFKATSTSDKVTVKANSNSVLGDFTIDKIQQLATAETLTNKNKLSTDLSGSVKASDLEGANFTGQTLKLDVNGVQKTIDLKSLTGKSTVQEAVLDEGGNAVLDKDGNPVMQSEMEKELQTLLNKAYGTKNVYNEDTGEYDTVPVVSAKITEDGVNLDSDAARVIVTSKNSMLGFAADQSNRVLMNSKISDIKELNAALQGDVLKFTINGVEISVGKDDTLNTLKNKIDSSDAGVRFTYSQFSDEFTLTSKTTGAGDNIVIRDTQGNLMNTIFGAQSGNGIGTSTLKLDAVPTAENASKYLNANIEDRKKLGAYVSDLEFELTINGVTKTVKADTSAIGAKNLAAGTYSQNDVIEALNKGIKLAFGNDTVKFGSTLVNGESRITLDSSDKSVAFLAKASTTSVNSNALSVMGFVGNTGNAAFDLGYKNKIDSTNDSALALAKGETGFFDVTINGVTKQISLSSSSIPENINSTDPKKKEAAAKLLEKELNDAIKTAFGSQIEKDVKFAVSAEGKISLDIKNTNTQVALSHTSSLNLGENDVDILDQLGFVASPGEFLTNENVSGSGVKFGELQGGNYSNFVGTLTINGKGFAYDKETNVQDFVNSINDEFGYGFATISSNGELSIKDPDGDIEIYDDGIMLQSFFGITEQADIEVETSPGVTETRTVTMFRTQASSVDAEKQVKSGKNAEIVVDGRVVASASNTFNINGVDITADKVSVAGDAPIKISVTSDPEEVITKLKGWIEDYNGLIATLNGALNEEKKSGYPPLTDEQKAEMTQDQIKTWETEAQKGMLRNDATVRGIAAELRDALYKKVEAAGISLYDIGITTKGYLSSNLNEAGMLEITDESKLRSMLTNNPDKVRMLFTDPDDGIATRINTIIDKAAKTSSVNRGSLITLAGTEILTGDNTSVLGKKIDAIDKYVTTLKARLESEYNRHWARFTSLETAIQKMNSQSSWLMQAGA